MIIKRIFSLLGFSYLLGDLNSACGRSEIVVIFTFAQELNSSLLFFSSSFFCLLAFDLSFSFFFSLGSFVLLSSFSLLLFLLLLLQFLLLGERSSLSDFSLLFGFLFLSVLGRVLLTFTKSSVSQ